jgi:mannan endo-1,4-beta-mannosidase
MLHYSIRTVAVFYLLLLGFSSCKKAGTGGETVKETPVVGAGRFQINTALVTPDPSVEAVNLYKFLQDNYGKKIISGVMTLNSFDETDWLKANTGKEPAIIGLDFMHTGRNYSWYDDHAPIKDAASYWKKNGIPVFVWHWRDPSRLTEEFYSIKVILMSVRLVILPLQNISR